MSRYNHRDRSRDRHGYRGRSESSDSYDKKARATHQSTHHMPSAPPKRRVKFADSNDIKVFRKDDEPNGKGLTQLDIEEYMKKLEAERGSSNFRDFNWESMKHRDAQLENLSIKQQKQREKILCERLQSVKQEIRFYTPALIKQAEEFREGEGSTEGEALSSRLNNVLACFYVQQSQIPGEPAFQIQNRAPCVSPKLISFNKNTFNNKDLNNSKHKQPKDLKPLKGILKGFSSYGKAERSESEPRRIDPALILLLKDINNNKALYSKEKTEMLLQPYKVSGELQYLKNNPKILASLFKQPEQPYPQPSQPLRSSVSPGRMQDPYNTRHSVSPQPDKPPTGYHFSQPAPEMNKPLSIDPQYAQYAQYQNYQAYGAYGQYPNYNAHIPPQQQPQEQYQRFNPYQQQPQQQNNMQSNRNFKTLPCKYFHSPQGCVKANGCTFIHDEQYAGKPSPLMLKSNRGVVNNYGQEMRETGPDQQAYYEYPGYRDGKQQ